MNRNTHAVKTRGVSVLVSPHADDAIAVEQIVERQLARGFGLKEHKERPKFLERIKTYRNIADLAVVGPGNPKVIAEKIEAELRKV